jgi:hypothetical protein
MMMVVVGTKIVVGESDELVRCCWKWFDFTRGIALLVSFGIVH